MATFDSPAFDTAVANLKSIFAGDPNRYKCGQFYLTNYVKSVILSNVEYSLNYNLVLPLNLNSNVDVSIDGVRYNNLNKFSFLKILLGNFLHDYSLGEQATSQLKDYLSAFFVDVNGADCVSLTVLNVIVNSIVGWFPPGEPDGTEARRLPGAFALVWADANVAAAPWLGSLPGTSKYYKAAFIFEKSKCREVCEAFAKKYTTAKGVTHVPAAAAYQAGIVAGATFENSGPVPSGSKETPQVVKYNFPSQLASAVSKLKSAIDAGGVVKCGVLSGLSQNKPVQNDPEHYVLLFAYGTEGGADAFLFWDPDAAATNIASHPAWDVGFGCLFVTSDRFSTAIDAADLTAVDIDGNHTNEPRRHRYQMFYLVTLPL